MRGPVLLAAMLLASCIAAAPQGQTALSNQTAQTQAAFQITPVVQPPPVLMPYGVANTPASADGIPPMSVLLHRDPPDFGGGPLAPGIARHLLLERVAMQRRQLDKMVAQLAQMAATLQADTARTPPEAASAALVQQVKAIEKLAKKIRGNLQYVPR